MKVRLQEIDAADISSELKTPKTISELKADRPSHKAIIPEPLWFSVNANPKPKVRIKVMGLKSRKLNALWYIPKTNWFSVSSKT